MKQVELDQYVVKDKVIVGEISITKIATENNISTIFTKALPNLVFLNLVHTLPLRDIH